MKVACPGAFVLQKATILYCRLYYVDNAGETNVDWEEILNK
jgi:hypothetical protein